MLSVRNMLIEPTTSHQEPREYKERSSVLDISSLLCNSNNNAISEQHHYNSHNSYNHDYRQQTQQYRQIYQPQDNPAPREQEEQPYVHILWARHHDNVQQQRYHHRHPTSHTYANKLSPISSPQHFDLLDKRQRRSSRQHQIESKKIEQELLHDRRQSSSSSSSSSVYSSISSSSLGSKTGEDDDDLSSLPLLKAKRRRASSKQLDVLNKVFERTFFPSTQLRAELGRQLGMSPRTVQIWFQNKRQAIRTRERITDDSSSRENSTSPEEE